MVSAMADMADALRGLGRATTKAYGEAGAARFTNGGADLAGDFARIDAAEVTLDEKGDKAAVRYPARTGRSTS